MGGPICPRPLAVHPLTMKVWPLAPEILSVMGDLKAIYWTAMQPADLA